MGKNNLMSIHFNRIINVLPGITSFYSNSYVFKFREELLDLFLFSRNSTLFHSVSFFSTYNGLTGFFMNMIWHSATVSGVRMIDALRALESPGDS